MGHQRLGKLPTHRYLPDIVRYLVTGGTPTAHLVEQITEVGRDALKRALKDPVFVEALWLLIRLPQAAASRDFGAALAEIGMGAQRPTSVAELMVAFDNAPVRAIAEGDAFTIRAGCDKRIETCGAKFANTANFRGFPHIPGQDAVLRYATKDGGHEGSVL